MKSKVKHLINSEELSIDTIKSFFDKADSYKHSDNDIFKDLVNKTVCLAFFEPSTRTKLSFEKAALNLSSSILNFEIGHSSVKKGESFEDTINTIQNYSPNAIVIRHTSSGILHKFRNIFTIPVINAGDGKHDHPSQGLLDAYTLTQEFGQIKGLRICIIGDILHSRVAKSNLHILSNLGAKISIFAPNTLFSPTLNINNLKIYHSLEEAAKNSDVLMELRIQNERMENGLIPGNSEFSRFYGLSSKIFDFNPKVKFMHPGPINYGVEIKHELKYHPNSLVEKQVKNGLFIRMALLNYCIN